MVWTHTHTHTHTPKADLPAWTHVAYSVHILTLKYACTNCCSPGTHFVAFRSSPISVSMQVQIYEIVSASEPKQSACKWSEKL